MSRFNLSEWALGHRSFVWYLMLAAVLAGVLSYQKLGREEDPAFTIKTMIVQANWPGATVEEMTNQVTDRIERKLQELGQPRLHQELQHARPDHDFRQPQGRHARPRDPRDLGPGAQQGERPRAPSCRRACRARSSTTSSATCSAISTRSPPTACPSASCATMPSGPRTEILKIPAAGKVELLGAQDEVIYLDFSLRRVAASASTGRRCCRASRRRTRYRPPGVVQAGPQRVSLRVTGGFTSEESLRAINIRVRDHFFRLADVATITRGYVDPAQRMFRYNGQPAIGLAIGMKPNNNLVQFGTELRQRMREIVADLPIGVGVHLVSNQPAVVEEAVGGFTHGAGRSGDHRARGRLPQPRPARGLVVAISIPLVLAGTFLFMEYSGVTLQRISLGALIIALGLLVDDAMISVEMMVARREEGDTLEKAATFAYTSTAFPMLTGTLVTVAGFVPIGLNGSSAGEYTFTLFAVIASALLISWIVAVLFTPLLGVTLLPRTAAKEAGAGSARFDTVSAACSCGDALALAHRSGSRSGCSPCRSWGWASCRTSSSPPPTGPSCWST